MKNYKRYFKRKIAPKAKRGLAFYLALILFFECGLPSVSFALTGGPSQPEVQSFEPIGTSDMVDVFSGDFSYNLPLIDVEGYPINLSYHSGISMDQEASWCGLGWNINPGVVNRNMRGIPDDFAGDAVVKDFNIKENSTVGVSTGFSGELFGLDFASFNARLGIKYNNYNGVGIEKSFNVSVTASNKSGGSGSASLGITSSSDDGLSLQPSLSLSQKMSTGDKSAVSGGVSIGASFNSRSGLSNFTVGANVNYSVKSSSGRTKTVKDKDGKEKQVDIAAYSGSGSSTGASAAFDLGGATYSPSLDMPMENLSITGNFTLGGEIFGFDGSIAIGGYYTSQRLATNSITNPAYGYMNSQFGQNVENAMLDFNREKDGSFHLSSTYNLPVTNNTYDLYSVSGQGAGGSYRPMRSDVGHVFDAAGYSTSDGYQIGVEVGLGNLTHVGVSVTVNEMNSTSNDWNSSSIASLAQSRNSANYPDFEPYYFKEANEKTVDPDQNFYNNFGADQAARFDLDGSTEFNAVTTGNLELSNSVLKSFPSNNFRSARDRKSTVISTLTNEEVSNGFGLNGMLNSFAAGAAVKHHIGQISSVGTDGKRYVYGLPAYNTRQEETSFAVGVPEGGGSARTHDALKGIVTYNPGSDNSTGNSMGLDNYYNNITMPAFAHSYMLTAVISADYVDADNIKGPSDGDIGTYVKFNYNDITSGSKYKWRTPLGKNIAKYNDGLFSNENDDKGSYVYGEKQIFFLQQIETKNYIAKFYTSPRADALGVIDKNGEVDAAGVKQQKLDKVELISKASGSVIKTVHFKYDYELCQPVSASNLLPNNKTPFAANAKTGGKLTLKKVYFTYQNSDKGAFNAYNFKYAGTSELVGSTTVTQPGVNPAYDLMSFDRWGNYKGSNPGGIPLDVFPYCNQSIPKATADSWAPAWHLTKIELPSGGEINVNYESDDYAYVQNEQATQMYLVNTTTASDFANAELKVTIPAGVTANDLLPDDNMLNYRFRMEIANGKYDFVPGYAEIDRGGCSIPFTGGTAIIKLNKVSMNDNGTPDKNPIIKSAIQFGRLNNSRLIWDQPNASAGMSEQVLKALINSSFFTTIQQTAQGPNQYLYDKGRGTNFDPGQSWIKLKNTNGFKLGGGVRVKSVILNDNFASMAGGAAENSEYGQVYDYTTTTPSGKVISSGVAAYEPQIGGEENALKHPFFTETKKLLAPDDEHYVEAPFGESFFPSAGVGYSKVTVKNYVPPIPGGLTLKRHATGYLVHEFYTAKDFPTITDRTQLEAIQHKNDPFSLASLFHIESKDYMTVSQGFYVELNDMHGKPKADYVYGEDQASPISSTEFKYKSTPYGNGCSRLENKVTSIYPDGTVKNENIGLFFDAVGDLREQETSSASYGLNINIDGFLIAAIPVYIPVPIPSYSSDKTRFRSAVFTKVVQRFGILEQTTANQDGSIVTTKNLAYDAESGEVLLTQVNNNFEDPIYSFKYPAYWHYAGMAGAYKNIDYRLNNITFSGAGIATLSGSNNKFQEGDELEMKLGSAYFVGWVTNVTPTGIEVQKKDGTLVNGTFDYIKVIRSGARNLQSVDMANITTMVNPLNGIKTNIYDKVIQASSVEFGNRWRTRCECNTTSGGAPITTNAFVNGTKGTWRPVRNYLHLTGRSQNDYNNNTNLRNDGLYTSYTPFYKLNANGKWGMDPQNWTYASEITEFNPYGQELENIDALGRYSAATFGFNQTMATSVGANTQYKELGFDSFEDYNLSTCADKHFKFGTATDNTRSHTGRNSIRLVANTTLSMEKQIGEQCNKEKTCPGSINYVSVSHGIYTYAIQNGTGPYNIDAVVVSGTGSVQPTANGFIVAPVGNNYTVKVTVMDENGCTYTKLIKYPYNN
jgi:hypothetical protein